MSGHQASIGCTNGRLIQERESRGDLRRAWECEGDVMSKGAQHPTAFAPAKLTPQNQMAVM